MITKLFGLLIAGIIVAGSCILNGAVLKLIWGWFMLPIFGLPTLSLTQAIGVSLVIGFMTHLRPDQKGHGKCNGSIEIYISTPRDRPAYWLDRTSLLHVTKTIRHRGPLAFTLGALFI